MARRDKHPECICPDCDEYQSDGHGYDEGESSTGLCYACELAGCTEDAAACGTCGEWED